MRKFEDPKRGRRGWRGNRGRGRLATPAKETLKVDSGRGEGEGGSQVGKGEAVSHKYNRVIN